MNVHEHSDLELQVGACLLTPMCLRLSRRPHGESWPITDHEIFAYTYSMLCLTISILEISNGVQYCNTRNSSESILEDL